ncbi:hypothetical protein BaRGS_00006832 [Batillaria attramentaria]|uniref:Uncharacterized protein n=1 Tax=Batillaria attramentaria TaxID=370345 RepID=A0ABD0LS18_9CAEN
MILNLRDALWCHEGNAASASGQTRMEVEAGFGVKKVKWQINLDKPRLTGELRKKRRFTRNRQAMRITRQPAVQEHHCSSPVQH